MNFISKAKKTIKEKKKNQFDDDQIGEKKRNVETIRTAHNKRKVLLVYICCGFDNVQKNKRRRFCCFVSRKCSHFDKQSVNVATGFVSFHFCFLFFFSFKNMHPLRWMDHNVLILYSSSFVHVRELYNLSSRLGWLTNTRRPTLHTKARLTQSSCYFFLLWVFQNIISNAEEEINHGEGRRAAWTDLASSIDNVR